MGFKGDFQNADEREAFLDLMQTMLIYEPSKRSTIDAAVQSEWMQKWALPDLKRTKIG